MPACKKDEHFFYLIFSASANMFSINIPYPFAGSLTRTCVTAPTSFPFWITGDPLTSVVNRMQQIAVVLHSAYHLLF